ncbi:hypothetical protein ScPMuIL_008885 [Solemya velum]
MQKEAVYLGLKVDADGLHPVEEKLDAIRKAPVPQNVTAKKEVTWNWTSEAQKAYETCKQCLSSDDLVVHYDTQRELRLACDASSFGLGAVISHVMDDGKERPIAFASRTLNPSPKKAIPTMAAARMQRWAVFLSAHDYDIEYRKSEDHANADALSRLPHGHSDVGKEGTVYTLGAVDEDFPVHAVDIAHATSKDPVLSKVFDCCLTGWTETCTDEDLRSYHSKRHELSCEQGCVMWGLRVIIPSSLRDKIMTELHREHPGVCSMKAIARSYVWWPKLDEQIEQLVRECSVCQSVRSAPPKAPLIPWTWPTRPFQRVHVDFCEKDKNYFLVLVDSHSKWIDVKHMHSIGAEQTIDELRLIFAEHGLPEELVSDNGPQFTSAEFSAFMIKNGIKHTLVPPYHAASNGAAERSVRIVKESLAKQVFANKKGMSMKHRLANFLIKYRSTPHSVTGRSPAELMLKRQLRTRLSLVKPSLAKVVEDKQFQQKLYHDGRNKERVFSVGDDVRVFNALGGLKPKNRWVVGKVIEVCGPRKYLVRMGNVQRYVHVDHLLLAQDVGVQVVDHETSCSSEQPMISVEMDLHDSVSSETDMTPLVPKNDVQGASDLLVSPSATVGIEGGSTGVPGGISSPQSITVRKSQRLRRPVKSISFISEKVKRERLQHRDNWRRNILPELRVPLKQTDGTENAKYEGEVVDRSFKHPQSNPKACSKGRKLDAFPVIWKVRKRFKPAHIRDYGRDSSRSSSALSSLSSNATWNEDSEEGRSPSLRLPPLTGPAKTGRRQTSTRPQSRKQDIENVPVEQHIRTIHEDLDAGNKRKDPDDITAADLNPEFVHVQTLTKGHVFGLAHLILGDQPSFCVVSNSADCILVDKQFYRENASESLIRKMRNELCPYPTEVDLQHSLQTSVDWSAFRKETLASTLRYVRSKKVNSAY